LRFGAALTCLALLAGCSARHDDQSDRPVTAREFPRPDRLVSKSGATAFSTEIQRDSVKEAQTVMDLADIRLGMTVADIGAGEGYYTVRLAPRVGPKGRVLAQDIDAAALHRLGERVEPASIASSWSTCITRSPSHTPFCGGCVRRCGRVGE
jgi:16S rRNA C967 or C1407 C5-methylase (RsmB/RsmF family)